MTNMIRPVVFFVILRLCLCAELNAVESANAIEAQGYSENKTKDGPTKRGIKVDNYDPPPEYYRRPASSSGLSSYSGNRDNTATGYSSRPVAFPTESYGYKGGNGQQGRKGLHDRVSVGHYTAGSSHSGSGSGYGNHGYGSSSTAFPYGAPQAIQYEYYAPTGNNHGYSDGGDGIPVELYNRGYGGYGHGGEYTTYTVGTGHGGGDAHGAAGYQHGKQGYDKALLAKSFLIPLASAAVLGIAAALASNPLLLQLGTVSSIGKRKRRDVSHSMAYQSQRRN